MTGQEVRELRLSLGLSQVAFGRLVGVENVTVCRWETGLRKPARWCVRAIQRVMAEIAAGRLSATD